MPTRLIKPLIGQTFSEVVRVGNDGINFNDANGECLFRFFYNPDCCAECVIEQIDGDLNDLCGAPILMAEYVQSEQQPNDSKAIPKCPDQYDDEHVSDSCDACKRWWDSGEDPTLNDSNTWTFVKLATALGYVTVRWWGSSNGYYSEAPSLQDMKWRDKNDDASLQDYGDGCRLLDAEHDSPSMQHLFSERVG